jgi:hypothetical protein
MNSPLMGVCGRLAYSALPHNDKNLTQFWAMITTMMATTTVAEELFNDPLTIAAAAQFEEDALANGL